MIDDNFSPTWREKENRVKQMKITDGMDPNAIIHDFMPKDMINI